MLLFSRQSTIFPLLIVLTSLTGCENNPDNASNANDYDAYAITATENGSGGFDLVARDFDSFSETFISRISGSPDQLTLSLNTNSDTQGFESFLYISEDGSELMHVNYDQSVSIFPQKIADITTGAQVCELSPISVSDRLTNTSGSFEEMELQDSRVILTTADIGDDCLTDSTFSNSVEFTAVDNVISDVTITPLQSTRYTFIDTRFINSTFEELNDEGETVTRERVGQAFSIVKPDNQALIQLLDEEDDQVWSTSLPTGVSNIYAKQISNSDLLWVAEDELFINSIDDLVNGFSPTDPTIDQSAISSQIFSQSIYALENPPSELQIVSSNSATFFVDGSRVIFITNERTVEVVSTFPDGATIQLFLVSGNTAIIAVSTPTGIGSENSTQFYSATRNNQNWLLENILPAISNQEFSVSNAGGESYISLCNTSTNQFESYFFPTIESEFQRYEDMVIINAFNVESSITDTAVYALVGDPEPLSSSCSLSGFTIFGFDRDTETGYTNTDGNLGFGSFSGAIESLPQNVIQNSDGIMFEASLTPQSGDADAAFLFDATLTYRSQGTATASEQRQQLKVFRPE